MLPWTRTLSVCFALVSPQRGIKCLCERGAVENKWTLAFCLPQHPRSKMEVTPSCQELALGTGHRSHLSLPFYPMLSSERMLTAHILVAFPPGKSIPSFTHTLRNPHIRTNTQCSLWQSGHTTESAPDDLSEEDRFLLLNMFLDLYNNFVCMHVQQNGIACIPCALEGQKRAWIWS